MAIQFLLNASGLPEECGEGKMGGKKRLTLPAWFSVFVDAPLVINVPDATGDDLNKYDSAAVATHTPGQMKKMHGPTSAKILFFPHAILKSSTYLRD